MPFQSLSAFTDLFTLLTSLTGEQEPCFLVGGAVRDALLGKPVHDLDFVRAGNVMSLARRFADQLKGMFYPLDSERGTARVILPGYHGDNLVIDFATFRGETLEQDLSNRDFTINAIALDASSTDTVIDPLNGAQNLKDKLLRACSESSMRDDPLRVMRGVRMALNFGLRIDPLTWQQMGEAAGGLNHVSAERRRDEFFRILEGGRVSTALRLLDRINVLDEVIPEVKALQGVGQSAPHIYDVWGHTLALVDALETLYDCLLGQRSDEDQLNLTLGYAVVQLGRFQTKLIDHFAKFLNPQRPAKALLKFAALYHDCAKPQARSVEEDGKVHFYQHEQYGAKVAADRGRKLALSSDEITYLGEVISGHMRPHFMAKEDGLPGKRAIYRYFRDYGSTGVDIGMLALADRIATEGAQLSQTRWQHEVDVVRALFENYWDEHDCVVQPAALVNGQILMTEFGVEAGPRLGRLLEAIREAQACGEVSTWDNALDFARNWLSKEGDRDDGKTG